MTARAPFGAHLRRRLDSHPACSRTRVRWRSSYLRVFVSIATAMPVGAIATESMSPRPCHGSEWRSRQPSAWSGANAFWTASSDWTPTRLRRASENSVARAQTKRSGNDEEAIGDETRTHAGSPQAKERGDDRLDARFAGAREPAVLLAPRIVDPVCPDDHRSPSSALARAAASGSRFGCLPGARGTAWRIASRAVEPRGQSRCPSRRASHSQFHGLPGRRERHCWRTTSTCPLGVGTLMVSERFATDLPDITPPPRSMTTRRMSRDGAYRDRATRARRHRHPSSARVAT